jgi:hypothetical protein
MHRLTMIKQLAQWAALMCSSRLTAIYGVESLVEEEANRPCQVYPRGTILVIQVASAPGPGALLVLWSSLGDEPDLTSDCTITKSGS